VTENTFKVTPVRIAVRSRSPRARSAQISAPQQNAFRMQIHDDAHAMGKKPTLRRLPPARRGRTRFTHPRWQAARTPEMKEHWSTQLSVVTHPPITHRGCEGAPADRKTDIRRLALYAARALR